MSGTRRGPVNRLLVTNDDGITSPGVHALAAAALERGLDVVVAAPAKEASGSSAAMTAVERGGQVAITEHALDGLGGVAAYAVSASPAFITMLGLQGVFGAAPDVVMSGINRGANAGRAVLHSGTVGAAFTAAAYGCHAIAVSLHVIEPATAVPEPVPGVPELAGSERGGSERGGSERGVAQPGGLEPGVREPAMREAGAPGLAELGSGMASELAGSELAGSELAGSERGGAGSPGSALDSVAGVVADAAALFAALHDADRHWSTAAALAMDVLAWLPQQPDGVVLNLNVPDLPPQQVRGLRRAGLARFGQAQIAIAEAGHGFVRLAMSEAGALVEPGTDLALLNQGYATVSPIRAVTEATEVTLPVR